MTPLRIIFMGTPDFAATALRALIAAGHDVAAVYSQPPRPAGRGNALRKSPVQLLAEQHGLPVRTPVTLKAAEALAEFAAFRADVAVVAAYGLILPKPILVLPRLGCLNIHASLLPRWRGAAPIQRAILAGDAETGISIMQMDEGLDTGPVLLQRKIPIGGAATAGEIHDALASLGAAAILAVLDGLAAGNAAPQPQPSAGVTYAAKLTKAEARLDWRGSSVELARAVRAFDPVPGAWLILPDAERLKVLKADPLRDRSGAPDPGSKGAPGTILDDRFTIACGTGALRLASVQRAGKRALEGDAFLRGAKLPPGTVLP